MDENLEENEEQLEEKQVRIHNLREQLENKREELTELQGVEVHLKKLQSKMDKKNVLVAEQTKALGKADECCVAGIILALCFVMMLIAAGFCWGFRKTYCKRRSRVGGISIYDSDSSEEEDMDLDSSSSADSDSSDQEDGDVDDFDF